MDLKKRHARLKEIFLEAVELNLRDLPDFLDRACGEDEELSQDVETLLKYHLPTDRETGPS